MLETLALILFGLFVLGPATLTAGWACLEAWRLMRDTIPAAQTEHRLRAWINTPLPPPPAPPRVRSSDPNIADLPNPSLVALAIEAYLHGVIDSARLEERLDDHILGVRPSRPSACPVCSGPVIGGHCDHCGARVSRAARLLAHTPRGYTPPACEHALVFGQPVPRCLFCGRPPGSGLCDQNHTTSRPGRVD